MRRKDTQSKKARRLNLRIAGVHNMSVFARRVLGIYGADHRQFDEKHPDLEEAVQGMRERMRKNKQEA